MARLGRTEPQQGNVLGEYPVRRRFYLTNTTSPVFDPSIASAAWEDSTNHTANPTLLLGDVPAGSATSVAKAETSASGTFDVLLGQWVSKQAANGGVFGGPFSITICRQESDAAANLVIAMSWWIIDSTGALRGAGVTNQVGSAEFNTTATAGTTSGTLPVLEVFPGDRIVLEVGYRATNTDTTSFTGTIFYGGTGADLVNGDTDTSKPSHIDVTVSPAIFAGEYTTAVAENAAATGAANDAAPAVTPNAENAAGTGAANQSAVSVVVNAENAAGTGAANQPAAHVTVNAENAAGTGAANNAVPAVTVAPASADATGAANNAGISTVDSAQAEHAAATGAANNAAPVVAPAPAVAQGVGVSAQPAAAIVVTIAGHAAATGAANNATVATAVVAVAEVATATGAANQPAAHVKVNAENAAATGAANNATVSTAAATTALAEAATATGAANNAAPKVTVNAENAAATGTAHNATPTTASVTNAPAGNADAAGAANNATVNVAPAAATSTATAAAANAAPSVAPAPAAGGGTGAANNPGGSATFTSGAAAATGAAGAATANVGATVEQLGQATGVARSPVTAVVVSPVTAAATGAAGNGSVPSQNGTQASAEVAGGDGAAYDPSILVRQSAPGGGWHSLLAVLAQARLEATQLRPQSCPHCGEPYHSDHNGARVCAFDGYRPDGPGGPRRKGGDWGGLKTALATTGARSRPAPDNPPGWGP